MDKEQKPGDELIVGRYMPPAAIVKCAMDLEAEVQFAVHLQAHASAPVIFDRVRSPELLLHL